MMDKDFTVRRLELYDKLKADYTTSQVEPKPFNVRIGPDTLQGVNVMDTLKKS